MRLALLLFVASLQATPMQNGHKDSSQKADSHTAITHVEPKPSAKQPTADDKIASYTGWLTAFTALLAVVAVLQLALLRKQFVATFRPRLIVRQVSGVLENGQYFVEFSVANDGGTSARIIESRATLILRERDKALRARPFEGATEVVSPQTVKAGSSIVIRWRDEQTNKNFAGARNESAGATNLFFAGYIGYRDGAGTVRRMGFYRMYSWDNFRFRPVGDPDFEYAD
jgi:hypothetical protein